MVKPLLNNYPDFWYKYLKSRSERRPTQISLSSSAYKLLKVNDGAPEWKIWSLGSSSHENLSEEQISTGVKSNRFLHNYVSPYKYTRNVVVVCLELASKYRQYSNAGPSPTLTLQRFNTLIGYRYELVQ